MNWKKLFTFFSTFWSIPAVKITALLSNFHTLTDPPPRVKRKTAVRGATGISSRCTQTGPGHPALSEEEKKRSKTFRRVRNRAMNPNLIILSPRDRNFLLRIANKTKYRRGVELINKIAFI